MLPIAAVCVTYLRPLALGQMLHCFLAQDYPRRELVILDDAGQYESQSGDRWRLVSVRQRFATLGEKRNAAVALVSPHVEAIAVWDDDDLYLPWALSASAAALEHGDWSRPSIVLRAAADGALNPLPAHGRFHAAWAFRREAFARCGGYPAESLGEDEQLGRRLTAAGAVESDPIALGFAPFFVWTAGGPDYHLSAMGPRGYRRLGARVVRKARLQPRRPEGIETA